MKKNRAVRRLVGLAAAATISIGVAAPLGFAQDPGYVEEQPATSTTTTSPAQATALARKKCINKAKSKFGDNAVKRKAAIKKCKKKFR